MFRAFATICLALSICRMKELCHFFHSSVLIIHFVLATHRMPNVNAVKGIPCTPCCALTAAAAHVADAENTISICNTHTVSFSLL